LVLLDRRIMEIASWLTPSRYLNPTLASRRQALDAFRVALRRGERVNPRLSYLPLPVAEMEASRAALRALEFGDTEADELLREQAEQLLLQVELLEARGTPRFGALAARLYGLPDGALLDSARGILRGEGEALPEPPSAGEGGVLDAEALAEGMRSELGRMGVNDWRVVVLEEMSARMAVSARHREVRVKSDSLFTREDQARLVVHELRTHVARACNGFRSGLLNLGMGLKGYMATEEGLASWMEQREGLLWRGQLEVYAYRAYAAAAAHEHSFAEVFRQLQELGASPGLAWDVTLRVKRGLEDTSVPGGFPKDYVYLHGRGLVLEYLARGGDEAALFVAKVSLEQLPLVARLVSEWDFVGASRGLPDPWGA
jgi:uncharacterized protein (TIGR02421 family)